MKQLSGWVLAITGCVVASWCFPNPQKHRPAMLAQVESENNQVTQGPWLYIRYFWKTANCLMLACALWQLVNSHSASPYNAPAPIVGRESYAQVPSSISIEIPSNPLELYLTPFAISTQTFKVSDMLIPLAIKASACRQVTEKMNPDMRTPVASIESHTNNVMETMIGNIISGKSEHKAGMVCSV